MGEYSTRDLVNERISGRKYDSKTDRKWTFQVDRDTQVSSSVNIILQRNVNSTEIYTIIQLRRSE